MVRGGLFPSLTSAAELGWVAPPDGTAPTPKQLFRCCLWRAPPPEPVHPKHTDHLTTMESSMAPSALRARDRKQVCFRAFQGHSFFLRVPMGSWGKHGTAAHCPVPFRGDRHLACQETWIPAEALSGTLLCVPEQVAIPFWAGFFTLKTKMSSECRAE